MKIDIQIPMSASIPEQLEHFQQAEAMGFDGAGLADHLERGDDAFVSLAMAALKTERIALYPCVSNPLTRHPWVLANVAHSIDQVSPGRFRLVVGAGDSTAFHTGKKPATVNEMRATMSAIWKLLHGEPVTFRDEPDTGIIGIQPPAPPVVIAAGARRMTELAGEIADELFLLTGFDERIISAFRGFAETGAARVGRKLDGSFKITHYTVVRIENDKEAAGEFGRKQALGWLKMSFFKSSLEALGAPESAITDPDSIPAAELDRLSDALFLIGPIEKIGERIQEIGAAGNIDRFLCTISGPEGWEASAGALANQVLPKVK